LCCLPRCDPGGYPLVDGDVVVLTAWLHRFGETRALVMTLNRDTLCVGSAVRRDVTGQFPCAQRCADLEIRRGHEPAIRRRRRLPVPFEVDRLAERVVLAALFVALCV